MDSKKLDCLVKLGNVEGVRKLVRQGTPLDYTNENRRSPLMQAAISKKAEMVYELLNMGASVDFTNDDGMTALHYAATHGSLQGAEALLEAGAELEARTNTGRTPLALACRHKQLPMAKMLLERGADPSARDKTGWPLLFMAARSGSLPMVKWLVEELDADPRPEVNGRTAEKLARDKKCPEVAEYLGNVLRSLPNQVKAEPSPRMLPTAAVAGDSKKIPGRANSRDELSSQASGGAACPPIMKVIHARQLVLPWHDVYDTTTDPPGLVLLFIYKKFSVSTLSERKGAEQDADNLVSVFEQMGYIVQLYVDKTWNDTLWILSEFSRSERLRKVGCAIVVVSSHGGEEKSTFATSDGRDVSVDVIHDYFIKDQSKEVREMAKLFFFQFCRGTLLPTYHQDNVKCEAPENIISFFSTTNGFVSYRHHRTGSLFLRILCEVLAERAHEDCLDDLFREVQRRYKEEEYSSTPEKQDLGFVKKFYFNPRRSRSLTQESNEKRD